MYKVDGKEFDDWTLAQDQAVQLLNDGHEYVNILQWSDDNKSWGLLQELNLERGIKGDTFSTQVLAPYYVRLRGL
tara:strand:- start:150 stop:374 length:225 start_codon:yes stop_codon:yes gene_type:complete